MSENTQAKKRYLRQHVVVAEPMTLGEWERKTGHTWHEPNRPRTDAGYKCDHPRRIFRMVPAGRVREGKQTM